MKAAVFRKPGLPLEITTVADPAPLPHELVIRVCNCGICGSDLHATEPPQIAVTEGVMGDGTIMGHEFSGEVVAIGSGLKGGPWREGQRVTALPFISCRTCGPCRRGQTLQCQNLQPQGFGIVGGAYAEYARVGAAETVLLPDAVSFRDGALIEPLAVGLHAVQAARIEPGANVLVLGAGPIGLATTLWARYLGARTVVVSERAAGRQALAQTFGATHGIDAGQPLLPQFEAIAGGPPDVIFECVGVPGLLQQCIDIAPFGGTVVVVGVCNKPDTIVPVSAIVKEITFRFVLGYVKRDFEVIADLLGQGRISGMPMLTDVIALDDLPVAFEALRTPSTQCKVMVEF
ncbi:zinc-binding dehydrogenase [Zavarzinia sp. CC-PAN008]|uniref:zinc-binding dehydrogenase n=1 Tax=Zavarzinia sp. CC-PAN008 TaxID=3243332 RepID=UPI003F746652